MAKHKKLILISLLPIMLLVALWQLPTARLTMVSFAAEVFPSAFVLNESVTENSAYGFTIGWNKSNALKAVKEYEKELYIDESYYRTGKTGILKLFNLSDEQLQLMFVNDKWTVYIDNNFANKIELYFEGDKLTKIRRFRRTVELP